MGAQIAAHFANAGVPALLLDLSVEAAAQGLQRARTLRPDPFFTPDAAALIAIGSFDDGLRRLHEADWIIEAVVERLDVKRDLLAGSTPLDGQARSSAPTRPEFRWATWHNDGATTSGATGSARISSIRRDICVFSS